MLQVSFGLHGTADSPSLGLSAWGLGCANSVVIDAATIKKTHTLWRAEETNLITGRFQTFAGSKSSLDLKRSQLRQKPTPAKSRIAPLMR